MQNGAIKITKENIEWQEREKYGEDYFKKLHPIHCLDFSFDFKNYNKVNPEKDCPAFYFFCKEMIPVDYMDSLSDEEKETISKMLKSSCLSRVIIIILRPI